MTELTQADYQAAHQWLDRHPNIIDAMPTREEKIIRSALTLAARVPQTMDANCMVTGKPKEDRCTCDKATPAGSGASFDCGELDVALEWYAARQEMKPSPYLETLANAAKLYRTQAIITDEMVERGVEMLSCCMGDMWTGKGMSDQIAMRHILEAAWGLK